MRERNNPCLALKTFDNKCLDWFIRRRPGSITTIRKTTVKASARRIRPAMMTTAVREAAVEAGTRRIRLAMMTTATTILALLPVLTSTGRGSDIMVPMAIPSFGGMVLAVVTVFVVPILYATLAERKIMKEVSPEKLGLS